MMSSVYLNVKKDDMESTPKTSKCMLLSQNLHLNLKKYVMPSKKYTMPPKLRHNIKNYVSKSLQ